jgi:hypothetical protein
MQKIFKRYKSRSVYAVVIKGEIEWEFRFGGAPISGRRAKTAQAKSARGSA